MTKKKMKRKVIISSLLSLFLMSSFVLTASAFASKFDCSYANISCKGVTVPEHGTALSHSDAVYATKGQKLAVSNTSSGPFNLTTTLVDASGNAVSAEIAFTDTQFVAVPANGNYRVKVICRDESAKKRCIGEGMVSQ